MRDVPQQAPLGRHERLDALRHPIEILGQIRQLVTAPAEPRGHANGQVASGDLLGGGAQRGERTRHVACQRVAHNTRGQEHGHESQELREGRVVEEPDETDRRAGDECPSLTVGAVDPMRLQRYAAVHLHVGVTRVARPRRGRGDARRHRVPGGVPAILADQAEIGTQQRSTVVNSILAQSRQDKADAAYYRDAADKALLAGGIGAAPLCANCSAWSARREPWSISNSTPPAIWRSG